MGQKWYVLYLLYLCSVVADTSTPSKQPICGPVIQCQCYDLVEVSGVECDNVTDYGYLSLKLRDGSLYDFNETYEITLTGVTSLPADAIDGLIVYQLILESPTAHVSVDAFRKTLRLRWLNVRQSSMDVIPNFGYISNSLRIVYLDGSLLTSVGKEFQNLTLLEELALRHNKISSVDPDAFLGTNGIKILDLTDNLLKTLPPDLLDNMKQLNKIVLSRNRLTTVDGLLKAINPRTIYFDYNNLTDTDAILYENMTNLQTIMLNGNPIKKVTYTSFNFKIPKVQFIYLDHCLIGDFDVDHYQNLTELKILDLSYNQIEMIPNKKIEFGGALQLRLMYNKIHSFRAEIHYNVKRLFLTGNMLKNLSFLQLTQLDEVEIMSNRLEALEENDLRGVHGTEVLMLRDNKIERVDTFFFKAVRNDLQLLDLSMNRLSALNGSVRFLSKLMSLNISHNQLTTLQEEEFVGLNELSELYMQNNHIIALGGQLRRVPGLRFLLIKNNRINTIMKEQIPKSLAYLHYDENPIICNCLLIPFLQQLDLHHSPITDFEYCRPPNVSSSSEYRIDTPDSLFQGWPCPHPCSCACSKDVNGSFIALDCHGRNLSEIPAMFRSEDANNMTTAWSGSIVRQNIDPKLLVTDKLLAINLENTGLTSLEKYRFPYNLKELKLANNKLVNVPQHVMALRKTRTFTLSGNPWFCRCEDVDFKRWVISKGEGVLDINQTRCTAFHESSEIAGKLLMSLSDVDLCPTDVALYVSIGFSILTFISVILVLKVVYIRYELNIKVWLYTHGVSWVKQNDLDKDKQFEAFISFSHKDEEFVVNEIVVEIERKAPSIRLCLHNRNFFPGEFIHNNIMNAVRSSKRTVLVLSKNFLESEWCLLEFRAAHLQALEDKVVRILVIKVGDLPEDIDPAIQVYLKSTTYITWGEKYFWQKLLYSLPEPTKHFCCHGSESKLVQH